MRTPAQEAAERLERGAAEQLAKRPQSLVSRLAAWMLLRFARAARKALADAGKDKAA